MEIPSMDNGIFMGARASTDGGSGEEGREDKVEGDEDRDASNEVESMEEIGASVDKEVGFQL
jgi:hypothetical protein